MGVQCYELCGGIALKNQTFFSFLLSMPEVSLPDDQVSLDQISDTKNCGKCNKLGKEDAKAICCEFCFTCYHTKCADISDKIYKFLKLGGYQIHWFLHEM